MFCVATMKDVHSMISNWTCLRCVYYHLYIIKNRIFLMFCYCYFQICSSLSFLCYYLHVLVFKEVLLCYYLQWEVSSSLSVFGKLSLFVNLFIILEMLDGSPPKQLNLYIRNNPLYHDVTVIAKKEIFWWAMYDQLIVMY